MARRDLPQETLEEVAESGRLGRVRILKIAAVSALAIFFLGLSGLSWYFSSEQFQSFLDQRLRPRLKNRGITFGEIEVSALGEITLKNLRIRLPNGEELLIPVVKGRTNYMAALTGEAKATFDVSEIARQYFAKARPDLALSADSEILYVSLATSLSSPGDRFRGEIHLRGVRLDVKPSGNETFPIQFQEGTLSLVDQVVSAQGLAFVLPGLGGTQEGGEATDLQATFDGNIRSIFGNPEFVGGKVTSQIRTEPMWRRSLDMLNLDEVTRKIRWLGPLGFTATMEGPIFSPTVRGQVDTQDLMLRMRGDFRQINIRFSSVRGPVSVTGDGGWTAQLEGGPIEVEYFRHRDEQLQHLFAHATAFKTNAGYARKVLNLTGLGFAAYGGRAIGRLTWDLNERNIPLSGTLKGDTAYSYRLGFEDLELGEFIKDITSLDRPFQGRFSGLLEGRGRTLMLERMTGKGRMMVNDLRLGNLPGTADLAKALGAEAASSLRGLRLGNLQTDWSFQSGILRMPGFEVEGPDGSLSGSLSYDILKLDISGASALRLSAGTLARVPALRRALGRRPVVAASISGKVVEPAIVYQIEAGS